MKTSIYIFILFVCMGLIGCEKDELYDPNHVATSYSFFIAGHTYGKPEVNNVGFHPPFKNKFDLIQNDPFIDFGVLTGDVVIGSTEENWDEIDADFK